MMMMITSPFFIRPLAPCWLGYKLCIISQSLPPLGIFSKREKRSRYLAKSNKRVYKNRGYFCALL